MAFVGDLRGYRHWIFLLVVFFHSSQTAHAFNFTQEPNDPTEAVEGTNVSLKWDYELDPGETFDELIYQTDTGVTIAERTSPFGKPDLNPAFPPYLRFNVIEKATLFITRVNRTDARGYNCKLKTNTTKFATPSAMSLVVLYPPENTFLNTSANVSATLEKSAVDFVCTSEGNPPPDEYRFYYISSYLGNSGSGTFQAQVNKSGLYFCVPVNKAGEGQNASVHINVVVPPAVHLPSKHTVVEGNNASIFCNATGTPPLSIEWTKVNESDVLSNNSSLTLYNVTRPGTPSETVQYECTARNAFGDPASAVVTVHVYYRPENTSLTAVHANTSAIELGTTVNFTCTSKANPPPEFKLYNNGTEILSSSSSYFTMNVTQSGLYYCEAVNEVGRQQTNKVDITVVVPPSVSLSSDRTVIEGRNLYLVCNAYGSPSPSIEWTKVNGSELLSNTSVLTLYNVTRPVNSSQTVQYQCTARNGYGDPASAVVTVHIDSIADSDTNYTGEFAINETFTKDLADENSLPSIKLKNRLRPEILKPYEGLEHEPFLIPMSFRKGSIIVDFTMFFRGFVNKTTAIGPLEKAIKTGKLGSFDVDKDSLIISTTSSSSSTSPSPSPSTSSRTRYMREKCSFPYTGDRCDKLSTTFMIIIAVIAVIAVIGMLIVGILIYRRRCRKGSVQHVDEVVTGEEANGTCLALKNMSYANEGPSPSDQAGYVQVNHEQASGAAEGNYAEAGRGEPVGGEPLVACAAVDQSKKKRKKKKKAKEDGDIQGTPIYAQVNKSKKGDAASSEENAYAAVDMSKKIKKRKEGDLMYADLSDFSRVPPPGGLTPVQISPPTTLGPLKAPYTYENTTYADISQYSMKRKEEKPVLDVAAATDAPTLPKEQEAQDVKV